MSARKGKGKRWTCAATLRGGTLCDATRAEHKQPVTPGERGTGNWLVNWHRYFPSPAEVRYRARQTARRETLREVERVIGPVVERVAARLRETADALSVPYVTRGADGAVKSGIHPRHAANRLRKLAGELSSATTATKVAKEGTK